MTGGTGPGRAREIITLLRDYGGRWQVDAHPGGLDVLSAVKRSADGRHIRCIVARTAAELAAKLEAAEQAEP